MMGSGSLLSSVYQEGLEAVKPYGAWLRASERRGGTSKEGKHSAEPAISIVSDPGLVNKDEQISPIDNLLLLDPKRQRMEEGDRVVVCQASEAMEIEMNRPKHLLEAGLAANHSTTWVVMRDFNDILSQDDKRGRHPHPDWAITGFSRGCS
ncbi:unnamed protein product [Cuscuta campestris]|uniref:Uncharacterized protein n=1 Tax=Cuscuta campestris TaxID=132261 RepID=A0A484N7V2_9ASTE|nr:unnamed protein product [Cuscuta campestris]